MIILRQRCKKKHVGSVPYERTMQQGILLVWTPLTENVVAFCSALGNDGGVGAECLTVEAVGFSASS